MVLIVVYGGLRRFMIKSWRVRRILLLYTFGTSFTSFLVTRPADPKPEILVSMNFLRLREKTAQGNSYGSGGNVAQGRH